MNAGGRWSSGLKLQVGPGTKIQVGPLGPDKVRLLRPADKVSPRSIQVLAGGAQARHAADAVPSGRAVVCGEVVWWQQAVTDDEKVHWLIGDRTPGPSRINRVL